MAVLNTTSPTLLPLGADAFAPKHRSVGESKKGGRKVRHDEAPGTRQFGDRDRTPLDSHSVRQTVRLYLVGPPIANPRNARAPHASRTPYFRPSTSCMSNRPAFAAAHEARGAQGAQRIGHAAGGLVGDLDALAGAGKQHRVVADDVAAADGRKTDLRRRPLAGMPFAAVNGASRTNRGRAPRRPPRPCAARCPRAHRPCGGDAPRSLRCRNLH